MAITKGWGSLENATRRVKVSPHMRSAPDCFAKGGKVQRHTDKMAHKPDGDADGMAKGGKVKKAGGGAVDPGTPAPPPPSLRPASRFAAKKGGKVKSKSKGAAKQAAGALTKLANVAAAATQSGGAQALPGAPPMAAPPPGMPMGMKKGGKAKGKSR